MNITNMSLDHAQCSHLFKYAHVQKKMSLLLIEDAYGDFYALSYLFRKEVNSNF